MPISQPPSGLFSEGLAAKAAAVPLAAWLSLGCLLAGGCLLGEGCAPAKPPVLDHPPARIVLIVVDTLRRDYVSAYGGSIPTPRIDALADRGEKFENAIASFHQTTMSMASLFTGRTPSLERTGDRDALPFNGRTWCGMTRFAPVSDDAQCLPRSMPTLAEGLRGAGYWTAAVVTNLLLFRPGGYEQGFDRWEEVHEMPPTAVAANRRVEQVLDERPSDHFFLYVHYMDVHDFGRRGQPYATGPPLVDLAVGELLDMLDAHGLGADTLVVFTADHGERLGEEHFVTGLGGHNGNPSFEALLRIPLITSPPLTDDPVQVLRGDDLHRLLLRAGGAAPGPDPDLEPGELYLSELHYQTWRRGRWKIFHDRLGGATHLVDLDADPEEKKDVADAHPDVVKSGMARIDQLATSLEATVPEDVLRMNEMDRARLKALGYLRYVAPE